MSERPMVEILLAQQNGPDKVIGPFCWVSLDGRALRALTEAGRPSKIVLFSGFGETFREPGGNDEWQDVVIRPAIESGKELTKDSQRESNRWYSRRLWETLNREDSQIVNPPQATGPQPERRRRGGSI